MTQAILTALKGLAYGGLALSGFGMGSAGLAQDQAELVEPPVEIDVVEDDEGTWTVTYRFAEPQNALVLAQSPVTYREWEPLTDGVNMWRIGGMEGFAFAQPAQEASFRITAYSGDLPAAYTPFLSFSEGSYGVLSGQFRVKPISSLADAVSFTGTGESWSASVIASQVSIRSARPVMPSEDGTFTANLDGRDGTYVFVGDLPPVEGASFRGYVDPGLPAWLTDGFDSDLSVIFARLTEGWNYELPEKSPVFLVFTGYEQEGLHLTGGAIDNLLSLEMGGSDLAEPIPEIQTYVRWFIAHEAAHIFQQARGNPDVAISGAEHAWVHEGSANTFSYRIGAELSEDPQGFLTEVYAEEYRDCVSHLERAPLVAAREMGNFRAYYACGDLIALATDAILPDHDLFDFWNALQDATLTVEGLDRARLYFHLLGELGADPDAIERLRAFVFEKPDNPAEFVQNVMEQVGLPITLDAEGEFAGITLRAQGDRKALH